MRIVAKTRPLLWGVQGVDNLLHLPDTPAPNKEASREAS